MPTCERLEAELRNTSNDNDTISRTFTWGLLYIATVVGDKEVAGTQKLIYRIRKMEIINHREQKWSTTV